MIAAGKKAKIFNVYGKPETPEFPENVEFVEEGFSWFALIIPFVWAIYRRVWWVAIVYVAGNFIMAFFAKAGMLSYEQISIIQLGFSFYVGLCSADWQCRALEKRSYKLQEVVIANSLLEAQEKYFIKIGSSKRRTQKLSAYA